MSVEPFPFAGDTYAGRFVTGLLDPQRAPPPFVSGPNGKAAHKRYAVYRNNVTVSLIAALAATFPATQRITGGDFFRAMARFYIRETPPTSPLLFAYGNDFPEFIARYEHARVMPWLPDVARIERAWLDAYHAADAALLNADVLASIGPSRLAETVFVPHPATRILRSQFPAVTVFAANRSDGPVGLIETTEAEDALITRPHLDVIVRRLPSGGAIFLAALISGATLGSAADDALRDAPTFDLAMNIAGTLEAGAFTTIATEHSQK